VIQSQSFQQTLRFGVAGLLVELVYFLTYLGLNMGFGMWYVYSTVPAALVQFGVNFALKKYWVFKNHDSKAARSQAMKFLGLHWVLFFLNLILLGLLVEVMNFDHMVTQASLMPPLAVLSFFVSRAIFRPLG
jgi:putative flippase GtrA